jgi:hypothetical protein
MPSPEETIDNLRQAITEPFCVIADPGAGQFLGGAIEEFEDLAIALACIHLFERADGEGYARNLQLCGFARQHFLLRTRDVEIIDDVYSAASRAQGDLAAFIAGDDALVREILALTAAQPLAGEYEEDFHYRKLLHHLMIATQIDTVALALLIDAFENARRGAEETRYALCVAFRDADEEGFWSAFTTLHDALLERRAVPPRTDEPWEELYRRLWLEGLVWLALVSRLRRWTSPETDYPLCPSWGHRRSSAPTGENIFLMLPIHE